MTLMNCFDGVLLLADYAMGPRLALISHLPCAGLAAARRFASSLAEQLMLSGVACLKPSRFQHSLHPWKQASSCDQMFYRLSTWLEKTSPLKTL